MIYIGTTAINRPDLHKNMFKLNNKFFKNYKEDICWVINIDVIDRLSFTYEETKNNYIECIKNVLPNCKIIFIKQNENPSFTMAVKNICKEISTMFKENDNLFWFEDDWAIPPNKNKKGITLNMINEKPFLFKYFNLRQVKII